MHTWGVPPPFYKDVYKYNGPSQQKRLLDFKCYIDIHLPYIVDSSLAAYFFPMRMKNFKIYSEFDQKIILFSKKVY